MFNMFLKFLLKIDLEIRKVELSEDNKGKIWVNNCDRFLFLKIIVVFLRMVRDVLFIVVIL